MRAVEYIYTLIECQFWIFLRENWNRIQHNIYQSLKVRNGHIWCAYVVHYMKIIFRPIRYEVDDLNVFTPKDLRGFSYFCSWYRRTKKSHGQIWIELNCKCLESQTIKKNWNTKCVSLHTFSKWNRKNDLHAVKDHAN